MTPADPTLISSFQAIVLGFVEGITEYLPISSSGHLVLASQLLGLRDASQLSAEQIEAVQAFEIVIQSGAILAVIALYGRHLSQLIKGLLHKKSSAIAETIRLFLAFMPAMIIGYLGHDLIKTHLQHTLPVSASLFVGGLAMIAFEKTRWGFKTTGSGRKLSDMTYKDAFIIGCAQCLALWPGTSRSMVTILAARMRGLSPVAAAEFSFLLGLPTLLAATAYKAIKDADLLITHVSPTAMLLGLVVSAGSAFFAVKGFVAFLNRHGLAIFGWYRVFLAAAVLTLLGQSAL